MHMLKTIAIVYSAFEFWVVLAFGMPIEIVEAYMCTKHGSLLPHGTNFGLKNLYSVKVVSDLRRFIQFSV